MQTKIRSGQSMLSGPIWKGLLAFAWPIFLGQLFQQLYNTADTLIVGNFISKEALAAVSSSGNLIFMLTGLLGGIAMGGGVLIAKFFGAKDYQSLQRAIHTGLAFALLGGVILTLLGVFLAPVILRWMGTPPTVLPNSVAYFRTYFLGALPSFFYNVCVGILQAVGDSRHPLLYLIISSILNVLLDLLFVAVFGWGVAAAAAATVIAQTVSALLCLLQLLRGDPIYRVNLRKIRLHRDLLGMLLKIGIPSGIQNCAISLANVIVQANINNFGADAMAGCGSYAKVEGFAFLPVTCFSMGLATFVGQNLGAKQYDRVKQGNRFGVLCSVLMAEVVGLAIYLFAPYLIKLFNSDPNVVAFGARQAKTEALFYCCLAFSHCMAGIFRGAGKSTVPMAVMLCCWCLIRVTYITGMIRFVAENILVVFSAYPLTWTLSGIFFTVYYFKSDWIHHFDRLDRKRK